MNLFIHFKRHPFLSIGVIAVFLVIPIVILLYYLFSFFLSPGDGSKQYAYFSNLAQIEGTKISATYVEGSRCLDACDGINLRLTTTREMPFDEFQDKLKSAFLPKFEITSDPKLKPFQMVSIDKTNGRFCEYATLALQYGYYPDTGNDSLSSGDAADCSLLKPYWRLSAAWVFEQQKPMNIPSCKSLKAILITDNTTFEKDRLGNQQFAVEIDCDRGSIEPYSLIDSSCGNFNFCGDWARR